MRNIEKLILHCSDSNLKAHDSIDIIRQWHLERGFTDVGYHFFIKSDGVIEKGRDIDKVGAHCKGQNSNSIGICLHGKNINDFNNDQFTSLNRLLNSLCIIFPEVSIHGHNEYSKKTCPVFNVEPFKTI